MDYFREHSIKIKIIRIFNTYGPNMTFNDGRVISNFILQSLTDKDITIYGSGEQTRSFQYVDDLIIALIKMMNTNDDFTGPINIGNSYEISVNDLASKIINLTKSNSKIIYKNLPQDDPKRRKPNISLAKRILNWEPEVDLDKGLINTINYFKKTFD